MSERLTRQELLDEIGRLTFALEEISQKQEQALGIIESNGFVFDDIGQQPGSWKHLAFTLYTEICEIDMISRTALDIAVGDNS